MDTRLGLVTDWHRNRRGEPKGLQISDARVTALPFNLAHWPIQHSEFGLGLLVFKFCIEPGNTSVKMDRRATVTKHVLGRRYQKGWPSTDEACLEDLKHLVNTRMTQPKLTKVVVDSGSWVGDLMRFESDVVLSVMTFLEPNMRGEY